MLYRFFSHAGLDEVPSGEGFDAEDDGDALLIARLMTPGGKGEVWQGARFVGLLTPPPSSVPDSRVEQDGSALFRG